METIKQILMERDEMTAEEADEAIDEAKQRIFEGENPEDILREDFGLEMDYIFDLI